MTKRQDETKLENSVRKSAKALVAKIVERDPRLKAAQQGQRSGSSAPSAKGATHGVTGALKNFRDELKSGK